VDFSGVEKWEGRLQEKKEQDTERRLDEPLYPLTSFSLFFGAREVFAGIEHRFWHFGIIRKSP